MARSAGNVIENNFTKGLITEATGLNFPENAVTETWDCVFEPKGVVRRRLGIDLEAGARTVALVEAGAVVEYLWEAVSQRGSRIFLVLQLGSTIRFYELGTGQNLSGNLKDFSVEMTDFETRSSSDFHEMPCAFTAGNGRLFIVHPMANPVMVEYDEDDDTISTTEITIKVRDFEGVDDGLEPAEEPDSLSPEHHYNLKNQGWYPDTVTVVTKVTEKLI